MYIYATFELREGTLRWTATGAESLGLPSPSADYDPGIYIDRIVILGAATAPYEKQATVVETGQTLTVEGGPILAGSTAESQALVIRKPHLPIKGSWSLKLQQGSLS